MAATSKQNSRTEDKKLRDAVTPLNSTSAPAFVLNNSRSFSQGDELVGGESLVLFVQAVGPVDIEVNGCDSTQTKMQAGIVTGIVTGLAQHGLRLYLATIVGQHPRSNRAAVGFHSFEFHLDPVLFSLDVISQQGWRFIHIDDEDVEISVIIEISEGAAAAGLELVDLSLRRPNLETVFLHLTGRELRD